MVEGGVGKSWEVSCNGGWRWEGGEGKSWGVVFWEDGIKTGCDLGKINLQKEVA